MSTPVLIAAFFLAAVGGGFAVIYERRWMGWALIVTSFGITVLGTSFAKALFAWLALAGLAGLLVTVIRGVRVTQD